MKIGILGSGVVGQTLGAKLAQDGHDVMLGTRSPQDLGVEGKILIDAANPLDFSKGMPPRLSVCNDDSLGEQIQRAFPRVRVVKALNTVTAGLMVNPDAVAGGEHHLFICGDDAEAKRRVTGWLREWFGWRHVIDVGPIDAARGTEMVLPLWIRLMGTMGSPLFNFRVVQ